MEGHHRPRHRDYRDRQHIVDAAAENGIAADIARDTEDADDLILILKLVLMLAGYCRHLPPLV